MWRKVGFFLGLTGLFLGVTVVAYELNFGQKIIPRVFINGFEVSGMSREETISFLRVKVEDSSKEIALLGAKGEQRVGFGDLGVDYQFEKTVDEAWRLGRKNDFLGNCVEKYLTLKDGARLPFVINYDPVAVDGLVASMAAEINNKPVEPRLMINKQKEIVFVQGKNGEELDEAELKQRIIVALENFDLGGIKLPTKRVVVEETEEEIAGIKNMAQELMSRELILKYSDYSKKIGGSELVGFIGFQDKWNREALEKVAGKTGTGLNREAQDARFEFKNERLADFSADLDGIKVEEEMLIEKIVQALEMNQGEVEIPVKKTLAKIRAGEINNLGIKELLGEGKSTYFHSIPGRVHNVSLAASRINGVMVPPGEVFSFNKTVGDVSAATGYEAAYIIKEGRTVLGDGGGVCQVSTTLFRAVLNAGLPIVERQAHAYRVSYYEQDSKPGLDATVYDPTADLKFKNDTEKYILIQTKADPSKYKLDIEIFGTSDGRVATVATPKIFSTTPPPEDLYVDDPTLPKGSVKQIDFKAAGAKVAFDYLVERNGEVIFKKTFYSNYQPWQAVFLRGTGG